LPYYIATEWGTPLETFKNFIRDLDGGIGKVESEETDKKMDYQTYRTQLNSSQAEGLKEKNPFLMLAYADVTNPKDFDYAGEEEWRALPSHQPQHMDSARALNPTKNIVLPGETTSIHPRRVAPGGKNAPYWKKMISSPLQNPLLRPPTEDPPYHADDSWGKGVTIYVIDDGFDINHPVSASDRHRRCI
jgi:hypothetical protein